jgi:hypothetical protein
MAMLTMLLLALAAAQIGAAAVVGLGALLARSLR